MNELPDFGDGNTLADEVLGTTLDEDMEEASNSPEAQASRDDAREAFHNYLRGR